MKTITYDAWVKLTSITENGVAILMLKLICINLRQHRIMEGYSQAQTSLTPTETLYVRVHRLLI